MRWAVCSRCRSRSIRSSEHAAEEGVGSPKVHLGFRNTGPQGDQCRGRRFVVDGAEDESGRGDRDIGGDGEDRVKPAVAVSRLVLRMQIKPAQGEAQMGTDRHDNYSAISGWRSSTPISATPPGAGCAAGRAFGSERPCKRFVARAMRSYRGRFASPLLVLRHPVSVLPHLSELHGAATHLAVVAIPLYVVLMFLRRAGRGGETVLTLEPWVLGATVVGVAASGATGLLVWGQAQQGLRGQAFRNGNAHFWLGIALAVVVLGTVALRYRPMVARVPAIGVSVLAVAVLALAMVGVQGYLGGRMTYEHGVGVNAGGQFAQTATGAEALNLALAQGQSAAQAGAAAFSTTGLGCAACHGEMAQGARAPSLAGGRDLGTFRQVHAHGLFPPAVVTDKDFAAVNAFLRSLPGGEGESR